MRLFLIILFNVFFLSNVVSAKTLRDDVIYKLISDSQSQQKQINALAKRVLELEKHAKQNKTIEIPLVKTNCKVPPREEAKYVAVTSYGLHVRKNANLDSRIVTFYKMGDIAKVFSYENGWYKVKKGYIVSKYTTPIAKNCMKLHAVVTVNNLILRKNPSFHSKKIKTFKKGEIVTILPMLIHKDFYMLQSKEGFLCASYLQIARDNK